MDRAANILYIIVAVVIIGFVVGSAVVSFTGIGNREFVDFKHDFDEAVIAMPDGRIISGEIQSWNDYHDSDVVQVKIDGIVYVTHYTNVTLIRYE